MSLDLSGTRYNEPACEYSITASSAASRRAQSLIRDQSHGDSDRDSGRDVKEEELPHQLRLGTFTTRLIASLVQDTEVNNNFFAKTHPDHPEYLEDTLRLEGPPSFAVPFFLVPVVLLISPSGS